ncbi:TetR/AcrR family transcriptional regulator [Pseudogemmobacter sonorensis]|uniref:TetR/AcrR family transcriptional regulator n=1 Tax=Pseudogemmobacter sonorensis TaxID=2989681 RepID=UPI0036986F3E
MIPPDQDPHLREGVENRREALILAARSLVSEGGVQAATVRAIAARAGVTQGLIRHYFGTKEDLLREAYGTMMDAMTDKGLDALEGVGAEPGERLAAFVAAALRPPVLDIAAVGLWAGYLHRVQADAALRARHERGYLRFRDRLQGLVADLDRPDLEHPAGGARVPPARLRQEAIACTAVIDGLWLEGSVLPAGFAPGEVVRIGLRAVGAILGVDLMRFDTFVPELRVPRPEDEGEWHPKPARPDTGRM